MNRNLHSRGQHLDSFPLMVHYSSSSSLNLTFPFTSTSVWENTIICHVVGTTSVLPVLFEYLLSDNGIIFYILYILYIPAAWWTAFCWTWRGWVRRYLYNISKYIYIYIYIIKRVDVLTHVSGKTFLEEWGHLLELILFMSNPKIPFNYVR